MHSTCGNTQDRISDLTTTGGRLCGLRSAPKTVVVLDTYLCNKGRVQSVLGNTVQIEMRHAHLDIAAASSAEFAKKRTSALAQR